MSAAGALALRVRAAGRLAWLLAHGAFSPARRAARRHHRDFYRRLWTSAAASLGLAVRDLGHGRLEIDVGTRRLEVRGTHCSIDDPATLARAGDKVLVHRLLAERGLPMPAHAAFTLADLEPARRFLDAAPGACVVKPGVDGAVGRGVVTGLRHEADLGPAAAAAAAVGARASRRARTGARIARLARMMGDVPRVPLLIEHQIPGENYRLLYLDGVLIDAIRRASPTLAGDGRHRVRELVERLNAERLRGGGKRAQMLVSTDLDYERTVRAQGLTPDSIPAAGAVVRLKTTINESAPEHNHPARDELCAAVVEQGALAAATVGARWAGVDIITADPAVPLEAAGGVVLEVNTTPGLAMHLHGRPGQADPAVALLSGLAGRAR
jgi:cyanophycin synthetase